MAAATAACTHSNRDQDTTERVGLEGDDGATVTVSTRDSFGLESVWYGRLVDVYSTEADGSRRLTHVDFVVGESVGTEGGELTLEEDPVLDRDLLVVAHASDSDAFRALFAPGGALAESRGMTRLDEVAPGGARLGVLVPRDAALVLEFDDWIDERSLESESVRLVAAETGEAAALRVMLDAHEARRTADGVRAARRVVIDGRISEYDAVRAKRPLELRAGLPGGANGEGAELVLELATAEAGGGGVLRNLAGIGLAARGTVDFQAASQPQRIALRTASLAGGGSGAAFLGDTIAPRIVGRQAVTLLDAPIPLAGGGPRDFLLPRVQFVSGTCAVDASRGDVLAQAGFLSQVKSTVSTTVGDTAFDVPVRLLAGDQAAFLQAGGTSGQYRAPFDAGQDVPACFVEVTPTPLGYPAQPAVGLDTDSTFTVSFNEGMLAQSLAPYDALILSRTAVARVGTDFVPGSVRASSDLRRFAFESTLELAHRAGQAESYWMNVIGGALGARDLAGNELADSLLGAKFQIDPLESEVESGGRVLRFSRVDEEPPYGMTSPLPEWVGQHQVDSGAQTLSPRPVTRFEAVVDRAREIVGTMTPLATGPSTPLNRLGAKLQSVWRPCDAGLRVADEAEYNLDVEGLSWAPLGGQVLADSFSQFEIALAHSSRLPDEYLDPASLFPEWEDSGLERTFDDNVVGELQVVHDRGAGYAIDPGDLYTSPAGTALMPYPLNQGVPADQRSYFTWRDTAMSERGGADGSGAEPDQLHYVLGEPMLAPGEKLYDRAEVKTAGLPLLMEFRTWPDANAIGLNSFEVSVATNSSARPYFRAFSAGGTNQQGIDIQVDPDLELEANGGFNRNSNPPGAATYGRDPIFHLGSMSLVTRVSRSYSTWFEAVAADGSALVSADFVEAELVPALGALPAGTEVQIAFRGATSIQNVEAVGDATSLDYYGDHYDRTAIPLTHNSADANIGIDFVGGSDAWVDDLTDLAGARYYQMRLTFLSNADTNVSPAVSAVALSWQE